METEPRAPRSTREWLALGLAVAIGLFTFYTVATGAFESLIQRGIFVALVSALAVCLYPLGSGTRWRPLGLAVDLAVVAAVWGAAGYAIWHFERIMVERPFAEPHDVWLAALATVALLELARRAVSIIFPILVGLMFLYAFLGDRIPGAFGHRGFDQYFIAETVFLSDLGLWGMLVGIAATTLAAFILFGAFLLHTGAGTTFFKLSARAAGSSVGGAGKIATVASGFFGMISGSTVANVATTGNFTIPLMKRLRYPAPFAGGVEAIASTGGQLAPPIMGTAAFVMAELVGESYWRIAAAAILPAICFYVGVFVTIDAVARRRGLYGMEGDEVPSWSEALDWRALTPIVASLGGILFGVVNGNSIGTTAFYGIVAMILAFVAARLTAGEGLKSAVLRLAPALETGGRGVVIVGIMLTVAQVFVSLLNLTGVGVTLTGIILGSAGGQIWAIAIVMAIVCLIAGMGLPTSAAYVLVAAVFAPALIQLGIDALKVHFFVLYYATLSVVTPPVCVGVFVAAQIAGTPWFRVAVEAVRLGAVAYVLPMLFLAHDGFLGGGGPAAIAEAAVAGIVFTLSLAFLLGGRPAIGTSGVSRLAWAVPLALAALPGPVPTSAAGLTFLGLWWMGKAAGPGMRQAV
ncbi:TRAP transporter fused permease subunit [Jannaschia sp. LMIT008]|uniref:TRAP transporter permease n=1 Tax=Jannaschia maritima TaxID=3032585 RepID=UPI0028127801|nr:TRAP transporter fused permease subunit [Jannaschia sp. LMIT008]